MERLDGQRLQIVQQRLGKHRIEQRLQRLLLSQVSLNPLGIFRAFGQPGFDLGPP